jgi:hypothetical protein
VLAKPVKRNAKENAGVRGDGKDENVAGMEKFFDLFPFYFTCICVLHSKL